jgi:hypothetical protein
MTQHSMVSTAPWPADSNRQTDGPPSASGLRPALPKHHLQFPPPMLALGQQFPLHLRRKVAQHRLVGRMNPERRPGQQQTPWQVRNLRPGKVPLPLKRRQRAPANSRLPVRIQRPHPDPLVQHLQRQVQVVVRLQRNQRQPSITVQRQQVQHPAIADRKRRHLRIQQVPAQPRQQFSDPRAQLRLQPVFRLHAVKRIGVHSVWPSAPEKPFQQCAANPLRLFRRRSFISPRPKRRLILMRKNSPSQTHAALAQTPGHAGAAPPRWPSWPALRRACWPQQELTSSAAQLQLGSALEPRRKKTHEPAVNPNCPYGENQPAPALRCAHRA